MTLPGLPSLPPPWAGSPSGRSCDNFQSAVVALGGAGGGDGFHHRAVCCALPPG